MYINDGSRKERLNLILKFERNRLKDGAGTKMDSNVTRCPNLIIGNYCFLPIMLVAIWTSSQENFRRDRGHVHMNSTIWLTLTGFVKWLGRTGQCVVDETEKGWFITYIDRDPETLAAQEKKAKKQKMDKDDEERLMEFIDKQVEKGKREAEESGETFKEPLVRPTNDTPLIIHMKTNLKPKVLPLIKQENAKVIVPSGEKQVTVKLEKTTESVHNHEASLKRKRKDEHNASIESSHSNTEGWLKIGLTVKVTTKSLGEKYYKAKGVITEVEDSCFVGKVKLKSPAQVEDHVIKLDQEHLETVIPALGRDVLILWGKYKGRKGVVQELHIKDYSVDVKLSKEDKIIEMLSYDQVCKYTP
ncbi:hypothetical protein KM043_018082 [Ampulex compressa]|nr:hypothetical protein KM043_018082 [Ampulex compressa]